MTDNSFIFKKSLNKEVSNIKSSSRSTIIKNENNKNNNNNSNILLKPLNKREGLFKILSKNKILKNKNNKIINKDIKSIKNRNPGIDLVRIVAMYGIIINHILFHGRAIKKYSMHDKLNLLHIFLFWHVNGFGLISGIVGYKTHKYSNLFYLWFCVFFYSVSIYLYFKIFYPNAMIKSKIYSEFFPVIFHKYWYFTNYFGLYLFIPIINIGIEYLTKNNLKLIIISIYGIYIIWHDFMNPQFDAFKMKGGLSILWFLILYITGAYFGKYKIHFKGIKNIIFCIICLFIFIIISLLCYYLPRYNLSNIQGYYIKKILLIIKKIYSMRCDSLPKIIQTISITLFLMNIKYNKYIGKIISFIGPLTFGVYLTHDNNYVRIYIIRNLFNRDPKELSLNSAILLVLKKGFLIFIICIIIDFMRNIIFDIFKIKKISIFLEKNVIKKLFKL